MIKGHVFGNLFYTCSNGHLIAVKINYMTPTSLSLKLHPDKWPSPQDFRDLKNKLVLEGRSSKTIDHTQIYTLNSKQTRGYTFNVLHLFTNADKVDGSIIIIIWSMPSTNFNVTLCTTTILIMWKLKPEKCM